MSIGSSRQFFQRSSVLNRMQSSELDDAGKAAEIQVAEDVQVCRYSHQMQHEGAKHSKDQRQRKIADLQRTASSPCGRTDAAAPYRAETAGSARSSPKEQNETARRSSAGAQSSPAPQNKSSASNHLLSVCAESAGSCAIADIRDLLPFIIDAHDHLAR